MQMQIGPERAPGHEVSVPEVIGAPKCPDAQLDEAAELLRKAAALALYGDRDGAMALIDAVRCLAILHADQESIATKDMWAVVRIITLRSGVGTLEMLALDDLL